MVGEKTVRSVVGEFLCLYCFFEMFLNIFLCLFLVDGIILLATSETIGDHVAGTFVTSNRL